MLEDDVRYVAKLNVFVAFAGIAKSCTIGVVCVVVLYRFVEVAITNDVAVEVETVVRKRNPDIVEAVL